MECGYNHTIAVKTDGSLYSCGQNTYGQLGLNDTTHRNSFTSIGSGYLYNSYTGLPQFGGGACHSTAIDSDNILNATGEGDYGQLGIGTGTGPYDPSDLDQFTETDESFDDPENSASDDVQDTWRFVVNGKYHTLALKIVSEVLVTDDLEEPVVWRMDF